MTIQSATSVIIIFVPKSSQWVEGAMHKFSCIASRYLFNYTDHLI